MTRSTARIEARVEAMLQAAGWVEEVRRLLHRRNIPPTLQKPFQFIGYSQLRSCIESGQRIERAREQIEQATRQFAKRQLTWFRKEQDVGWLPGFGDNADVLAAALDTIHRPPL